MSAQCVICLFVFTHHRDVVGVLHKMETHVGVAKFHLIAFKSIILLAVLSSLCFCQIQAFAKQEE